MNAVATPAQATRKAGCSATQRAEAGPAWDSLAKAVSFDMAEAMAQIIALSNSASSGPGSMSSIATLLDQAHLHLGQIQANIDVRPLTKAVTDEAYTAMFKPLSFIEGAIAMAIKFEPDIITPVLRVVHEKLDEAQNNLGDQALGAMLPDALTTALDTPAPRDAIQVAFGEVETLLNAAYMTEEDHAWSADSDRLLCIAHGLADEAYIRPPVGAEIDRVAFDTAALIRAARLVPGDGESPERKILLDQAAAHLNWITGSSEDCCDPGAPRPSAPSAAAEDASRSADLRECARAACYEIQSLAQAMQTISERDNAAENHPVVHGVMARIIVLSEIVYHAALLHGEAPMATLTELKNSFKGRL